MPGWSWNSTERRQNEKRTRVVFMVMPGNLYVSLYWKISVSFLDRSLQIDFQRLNSSIYNDEQVWRSIACWRGLYLLIFLKEYGDYMILWAMFLLSLKEPARLSGQRTWDGFEEWWVSHMVHNDQRWGYLVRNVDVMMTHHPSSKTLRGLCSALHTLYH